MGKMKDILFYTEKNYTVKIIDNFDWNRCVHYIDPEKWRWMEHFENKISENIWKEKETL